MYIIPSHRLRSRKMFKPSEQQVATAQTETQTKRSFGFWFAVIVTLIVVDQLTKFLAQKNLSSIFLNKNFAFSLPVPIVAMYAIYIAVMIVVLVYLLRSWPTLFRKEKIAWSFILAGGISNIGERIIFGYVKDFIPILTGIFNLADLFILFGLILLLINQQKKL